MDFIYYVYLESDKMAEELNKYSGKLLSHLFLRSNKYIEKFLFYIVVETDRISKHLSYRKTFFKYFFDHFLFIVFLFFKMVKIEEDIEENDENGEQVYHKGKFNEIGNLLNVIINKKLLKNHLEVSSNMNEN